MVSTCGRGSRGRIYASALFYHWFGLRAVALSVVTPTACARLSSIVHVMLRVWCVVLRRCLKGLGNHLAPAWLPQSAQLCVACMPHWWCVQNHCMGSRCTRALAPLWWQSKPKAPAGLCVFACVRSFEWGSEVHCHGQTVAHASPLPGVCSALRLCCGSLICTPLMV